MSELKAHFRVLKAFCDLGEAILMRQEPGPVRVAELNFLMQGIDDTIERLFDVSGFRPLATPPISPSSRIRSNAAHS